MERSLTIPFYSLCRTMATYKLRIILSEDDIRKLSLNSKPETVEELRMKVKEKCQLQDDFKLQYEDTEFHNSPFTNLDDIEDLPDERATVKVISLLTLDMFPIFDTQTGASGNFEIPSIESPSTTLHPSSSATIRKEQFPDPFDIPNFPVEVEHQLRQANAAYLQDQKCLNPPRHMKHLIYQTLAEEIFKYEAYPKEPQMHAVALALIRKHPCLTERGSGDGCSGWKNNLVLKMSNFRTKMRKIGCLEVAVKGGRRGATPSRGLKRPKRNEANYLANLPHGNDEAMLEEQRKHLVEETKKRNPSASAIGVMMDQTFALRRREIVVDEPPVAEMKKRWPALFRETQVSFCLCFYPSMGTIFGKKKG